MNKASENFEIAELGLIKSRCTNTVAIKSRCTNTVATLANDIFDDIEQIVIRIYGQICPILDQSWNCMLLSFTISRVRKSNSLDIMKLGSIIQGAMPAFFEVDNQCRAVRV
jgi:hypothetical protein